MALRVVFLSQTTLPCFNCAWYQQSWILSSLKTAERCFSGLRSAQRVSRCLPRRWIRSQMKGGKEGSLCSQTPQTPLGCSLCDPENLGSVCGLGAQLRGVFFASQGDPNITDVSSQIMLWKQLPRCLSLISTSLVAIADLQPGLRNIYIKEGCSQLNLFSCHCTHSQLFNCSIFQHLEGKCAQEKHTAGSLRIWGGFCKLQLSVCQVLL